MLQQQKLYSLLIDAVGSENVSYLDVDTICYAADCHPLFFPIKSRFKPSFVVKPRSADDLVKVLLIANKLKIPITPRGGGSNVCGATVPNRGGIVLEMKAMNKIKRLNKEAKSVEVQAGLSLETLERYLNRENFTLGHDPGSRPSATVGGAISTNGIGFRCGKYGDMGDQVLGLEVVLPSGRVIKTKAFPKSVSGYDLNKFFIGAEGTLGIITEAVLRIFPLPERESVCEFSFETFCSAFEASMEILNLGLVPTAHMLSDRPLEGSGDITGGLVVLEFEGLAEEVDAQIKRARQVLTRHGGKDLGREKSQNDWKNRHSTKESAKTVSIAWIDISAPIDKIKTVYDSVRDVAEKKGLYMGCMWYINSRSIGFILRVRVSDQDTRYLKFHKIHDDIIRRTLELGGTMTWCHGIGIKLSKYMKLEHGSNLDLMIQVKKLFDPNNILNPRKKGLIW
jgi:FAD/FMN-containing dehydrogenase